MPGKTNPESFSNTAPRTFFDDYAADQDFNNPLYPSKTMASIRHIAPLALWDTEKPFCLTLPLPAGQPKSNVIVDTHDVEISSARGREYAFKLDTHGFEYVTLPTLDKDPGSKVDMEGEGGYVEQMEQWMKRYLHADRVCIFDYTARKRKPQGEKYSPTDQRPPGTNAHIDQTPEAALARLKLHLSGDFADLLEGRVQLVKYVNDHGLWRPTFGPLHDYPLAVCDARSLDGNDLIPQDLVYPHYVGENYQVKYNGSQRWYYLPGMMPTEGVLIKNFDSKVDGRARLCAHAAFSDRNAPEDAKLRQSVEVRAIVFHKDM